MDESLMRLVLFTLYPLALGGGIVLFDRSASDPVRRLEAMIIPLFVVGVGGGAVATFVAQVFVGGPPTAFVGWAIALSSLGVAVLGAVAAERRDGIRELTVAAATMVGVSTVAEQGGLALVTPVVLMGLLIALRRAETEPPTIVLRGWMIPIRRGSVVAVVAIAFALPVGQWAGQAMATVVAAMLVGGAVFWGIVRRSGAHRVIA